MPQMRSYVCNECGEVYEDVFYTDLEKVLKKINCKKCGGKATMILGCNFFIDGWSPMTNDAQRDIEHFEKKRIVNGKYVSNQCHYREDLMKKDIPV